MAHCCQKYGLGPVGGFRCLFCNREGDCSFLDQFLEVIAVSRQLDFAFFRLPEQAQQKAAQQHGNDQETAGDQQRAIYPIFLC